MDLTDFEWAPASDEGDYKGDSTLNCQIGITPEGKFELRNSSNIEQHQEYDSPAELCEALQKSLESRASEVS